MPKSYDPNGSFADRSASAVYYVPESSPDELVAQALSNGRTHVVAHVDCLATWENGNRPSQVQDANYPYLLVQCGNPSGMLNGILVDARTGHTWTLWTNGQPADDGQLYGEALESSGWVYFDSSIGRPGPPNSQGAMDLATGVTHPLPAPLAPYFDALLAPDGTLYAIQGWKGKTAVDLYRMSALTATLVAHLPEFPAGIDASGTVWVAKPGGALTAEAGAMTIRVWNPGNLNLHGARVMGMGPGYVVTLGPTSSTGASGPVRVVVDTAGGPKTITVGQANVGNATWGVFQAPDGRWQLLTVSTE